MAGAYDITLNPVDGTPEDPVLGVVVPFTRARKDTFLLPVDADPNDPILISYDYAVSGSQSESSAAPLTGAGNIVAFGRKEAQSAAPIAGAGAITANGQKTGQSSAPISGIGAIAVAGIKNAQSDAPLNGVGALTSEGSSGVSPPASSRSGVRRLASSRAYAWNAQSVADMLKSVRVLLGNVEEAAKQADPAPIKIPGELAEIAMAVAPKRQTVDFIPARPPLSPMEAPALLAELKSIESRLEKLERVELAKEEEDEDVAVFLLVA